MQRHGGVMIICAQIAFCSMRHGKMHYNKSNGWIDARGRMLLTLSILPTLSVLPPVIDCHFSVSIQHINAAWTS
jgi:hypothetical protein